MYVNPRGGELVSRKTVAWVVFQTPNFFVPRERKRIDSHPFSNNKENTTYNIHCSSIVVKHSGNVL
jgi:hypothetical protein